MSMPIEHFKLRCIHQNGHRIEGIGLFVRVVGELGDILFPDLRNGVPDAEPIIFINMDKI